MLNDDIKGFHYSNSQPPLSPVLSQDFSGDTRQKLVLTHITIFHVFQLNCGCNNLNVFMLLYCWEWNEVS